MASIGAGKAAYSKSNTLRKPPIIPCKSSLISTCIGLRCKDGVILAVEKLKASKLEVPGSNRRIHAIASHSGIVSFYLFKACTGVLADARHLTKRSREDAMQYFNTYRVAIPGADMAERISGYVQAYTMYASVRPFGVSTLMAAYDKNGPMLYHIEPSGVSFGYKACAVGKGKQIAKSQLEKLKFEELSMRDALKHAAKIIHEAHDEIKDKEFELEMAWVGEATNGKFETVPKELLEEAERLAKESLEEMDED